MNKCRWALAVLNNCRDQLVALAARHAVPTIYEFSDAGGLIAMEAT
jgi:hypothetical protein